jgi:predicted Fe-Mo cluster-binding NifX family protein
MNETIIAIPSGQPGGMDAPLGAHFGHCDVYTLVSVRESKIEDIRVIPNMPHQQGGCMAPVQYLAQNGVKLLIAGGMGMRPLMGFQQVGIDVYYGGGLNTVGEAVNALVDGKLPQFSMENTCGGGGAQ